MAIPTFFVSGISELSSDLSDIVTSCKSCPPEVTAELTTLQNQLTKIPPNVFPEVRCILDLFTF